jgi:hypothetical protein
LDVIAIAVCAVICGADSWTDVKDYGQAKEGWLRGFLELPTASPRTAPRGQKEVGEAMRKNPSGRERGPAAASLPRLFPGVR